MDRNELEQKVLAIIREQKPIPETVDRMTPLTEVGIDSLDALSILFALEESFRISIPDEKARAIRTLDDMLRTIEELVPKAE